MLKIIILVCSTGIDPVGCNQTNAADVLRGPTAPTAQQCLFLGQALVAQSTLKPAPGGGYVKVMCVREREAMAR